MTFAETLAILNWAKEHGASQVNIDGVFVSFQGDAPAVEKSAYVPQTYSAHDTKRRLDQDMFGMDLESLGGTNG